MPGKTLEQVCVDCRSLEAQHNIRNRSLCSDCFLRYVSSKVLRRMESYRFKNLVDEQKPRLLLPLSGGISSLVLLHILDAQLSRQLMKQNRTAYHLIIAHVDVTGKVANGEALSWYEGLQSKFPRHGFAHPLSLTGITELDLDFEADMKRLGFPRATGEAAHDFFSRLLGCARTVTAATDLVELLKSRLIVAYAKQDGCEAILWGHSDSQLASRALAGVAKGRGGSLPADIQDGASVHGLMFNHPLRDLFKTEVQLYAQLQSDGIGDLLPSEEPLLNKASIRDRSIDELLTSYITSQGKKYPSIMANVVRTAGKLQATTMTTSGNVCGLCRSASASDTTENSYESHLCYACERLRNELTIPQMQMDCGVQT